MDANREPVLISGGGPVGLLLANLLGRAGLACTVIERGEGLPSSSMAIGITPPSLRILRTLELDRAFVDQGVRVEVAHVHENETPLGTVSFASLPEPYPFILSLPQGVGMTLLRDALDRYPHVHYREGTTVVGCRQAGTGAEIDVQTPDGDIESFRGSYVVGCDGHRSLVRESMGIPVSAKTYRPRFMMADVRDRTTLGSDAHLFFSRWGSIESFPLPGGWRRWVARVHPADWEQNPSDWVPAQVERLTDFDLAGCEVGEASRFRPRRQLVRTYGRGRIQLCGDAAHVMSPIGGQGMNTGFADAELLAYSLTRILLEGEAPEPLLAAYSSLRAAAFRAAAARAARGMWLGTRTGMMGSHFRRAVIRFILRQASWRESLPTYFAMLDLPFGSLDAARARETS